MRKWSGLLRTALGLLAALLASRAGSGTHAAQRSEGATGGLFRKNTTLVHAALGLLTALLTMFNLGLAVLVFGGFAVYEYWSERRGHAEGYQDFWEALLGLSLGAVFVLAVTLLLGVNG